ncbi:S8 family peptidase [uncultured Sphingomonas sp.]|uniref:S8 family peptidase n=1 Tax=uncultured Sphingomonas sp. TaxID=158754 RepID=UPI0035CC0063
MYSAPLAPPVGYTITPSTQQPTRSANDTAEFRRNYGANEFVNALYALDHGYTGQGVLVGVIDNGADPANPSLIGQLDLATSKDFGVITKAGVTTQRNVIGDANSDHGTPVTSIIVGLRDGQGTEGYAPDAKVAMMRIDDDNEDTGTRPLIHILDALSYAGAKGIKVINISLGSSDSSDSRGETTYGNAITAYSTQTSGLLVISAGNSSAANPDDASAITDANRSAVIFVVATNGALMTSQFGLTSYSSQAGSMMDRTVAAPGTNTTTLITGQVGNFSGTSSAAPVVTALAATILSKWPQLTGRQAGDIILNTATDIGAPGVDPVYGHGLINFQAALSPVNPTLSNSVTSTPKSISASAMMVPSSMSVTSLKMAISDVTVLDQYGRDFKGSLAGMVLQPEAQTSHWLRRRINAMGNESSINTPLITGQFGFTTQEVAPGIVQSSMTSGQMEMRVGSYSVHAAWNGADSLQNDVMGLAPFADGILAYVPQMTNSFGVDHFIGGGRLGVTVALNRSNASQASAVTLGWTKGKIDLRMSVIDETGTVMGMATNAGALNLGRGASTAMVEAHQRFGSALGWSMEGYGSIGYTRLKIDHDSLVTGSSAIIGSRVGIQATGSVLGGLLSFGVAQPLTVESGSARISYSSGYDLASQSLTYATSDASLAGRRQVQLTAGFSKGGRRSRFRLGASQNLQDHSVRALAGWGTTFD